MQCIAKHYVFDLCGQYFHSNELREPGALYRYMNWCTRVLWELALIIHSGGC